ncbi:MAG: hypothetical protein FJ284_12970, partial [Planctomycetes bacterium]|nr:hypothetical protein [Planctomycetota bacterium]
MVQIARDLCRGTRGTRVAGGRDGPALRAGGRAGGHDPRWTRRSSAPPAVARGSGAGLDRLLQATVRRPRDAGDVRRRATGGPLLAVAGRAAGGRQEARPGNDRADPDGACGRGGRSRRGDRTRRGRRHRVGRRGANGHRGSSRVVTRGLDRPPSGVDDSAGRIAADVREGRRRASAVHEAHVARHLATHGRINALVQPRHEASALEAAAVDRRPDGLLAGVPVSVKDCFPVRGLATSLGIRCRQAAVDTVDAAIVSALRQAGAVIVGKANVAQAMYLHETENPVYGRTVHPLDEDRGPGGSSGGDAALVAARVVPLAVGTDLAGSLRQPAHACGVAAFMPRSAVLGEGGAFDTLPTLQLVRPRAGFLARHVSDLALATSAIAPTITSQAPVVRRVGWWDDSGPVSASPAIRRAVAEAVDRLSAAGVEMVALDAGIATEAAWLHLTMLTPGAADIRCLFGDERPQRGVARLLRLGSIPARLRPNAAVAAWLVGRRTEARALWATPGRSH